MPCCNHPAPCCCCGIRKSGVKRCPGNPPSPPFARSYSQPVGSSYFVLPPRDPHRPIPVHCTQSALFVPSIAPRSVSSTSTLLAFSHPRLLNSRPFTVSEPLMYIDAEGDDPDCCRGSRRKPGFRPLVEERSEGNNCAGEGKNKSKTTQDFGEERDKNTKSSTRGTSVEIQDFLIFKLCKVNEFFCNQ